MRVYKQPRDDPAEPRAESESSDERLNLVRHSGASRDTIHGSNNAEHARRRHGTSPCFGVLNPRCAQTRPVLIRTLEQELLGEPGPGLGRTDPPCGVFLKHRDVQKVHLNHHAQLLLTLVPCVVMRIQRKQ